MHSKSIVAGALLAAAPMARATGSVKVHNACSFPVYLWSVSAESGPMQTINSGDNYSEAYQTNPNGGGVSLKISPSTSQASGVTQFEYTLDSTLWYDLSNINGWPFEKWGATLMPSDSSCRNVLCPAGVALCSQAYNQPDENWATAACGTESNMNLVLCSQQDNESTPSQIALNAVNGVIKGSHAHIKANVNDAAAAAPAPAPAPPAPSAPAAPAPAVTQAPAAPAVPAAGALTTFVTNIVTVTARDAEPSLAAEQPVRRHMHQHHHHHHA